MNFNINIDNIKPLLKAAVNKLNFGIGFSLYYDTNNVGSYKFQASKGRDKGFVFYNSVVKIITNPREYIKGISYQPPSDIDYINSINDYIKGTQLTILVDKKGFWLYRPNQNLISLINHLDSNIIKNIKEIEEGNPGYEFKINDDAKSIMKVISHNVNNYNLFLSYSKDLIKSNYPEVLPNYKKINLEEYKLYIDNILNDEDVPMGYEVQYLEWSDSLNFMIYHNKLGKNILKNMDQRGTNEWDENDIDLFINQAKNAKDLTIIKKS